MAVIHGNFGKAEREQARRMARLFGIAKELEEDILRDPAKYLRAAGDEITRLQLGIDHAVAALEMPLDQLAPDSAVTPRPTMKTIVVPADEWERMLEFARRLGELGPAGRP